MLEAAVFPLLIAFSLVGAPGSSLGFGDRAAHRLADLLSRHEKGSWLYGTGDGSQAIATTMTLVGIATTALAVAGARPRAAIDGAPPPARLSFHALQVQLCGPLLHMHLQRLEPAGLV